MRLDKIKQKIVQIQKDSGNNTVHKDDNAITAEQQHLQQRN